MNPARRRSSEPSPATPSMMPSMVLVDGSNVARCSGWRAAFDTHSCDDHELRRRLVDATCSWVARAGLEARVVFDGAGPWRPGTVRASGEVEVIGAGGVEGDDVIEQHAAVLRRARRPHWLVTSDGALRQVAGIGADRILDSEAFVVELLASRSDDPDESAASTAAASEPGGNSTLAASLDDDVRSRLERMRRGAT